MSTEAIRIAVCQLTAHPSVVIGDCDFLSEPFVPRRKGITLAELSRHSLDVSALQNVCKEEYCNWHSSRLQHVLGWLSSVQPLPNVVVFPECSIPLHDLHQVRDFSQQTEAVVFAGTHTIRNRIEDQDHYRSLGVSATKLKQLRKINDGETTILPVITPSAIFLHVKGVPSPFEGSDVSRPTSSLNSLETVTISLNGESVRVLPVVCAEALQLAVPTSDYDIVVIVAFNDGSEVFQPTVDHNVKNGKPVVFCNDGHSGGSSINVIVDQRTNGKWWWEPPIDGKLPAGDGVLIADVFLRNQCIQVGVNNPQPAATLVSITPIVAADVAEDQRYFAEDITRIRELGDNTTQSIAIDGCLTERVPNSIQDMLGRHLHRLCKVGNATDQWWDTLGNTLWLTGISSLEGIEAHLARRCSDSLRKIINESGIDEPSVLGRLLLLRKACDERASPESKSPAETSGDHTFIIDRETETSDAIQFFERDGESTLLVVGLDDVGKSTVVRASLGKTGHKTTRWIDIPEDATFDSLSEIIRRELTGIQLVGSDIEITDVAFKDRIPTGTVLVLRNAENLQSHRRWRDSRFPQLFADLSHSLHDRNGKLVAISSIALRVLESEPSRLRRLSIRGLSHDDARQLLDQQLRRAGLRPDDYSIEQRKELVSSVGGHPGAIILLSEYVYEHGIDRVSSDLKSRHGVHTQIVRSVLRKMSLNQEERTTLALLSHARKALPVSALNTVVTFNATKTVQSLIHHCLVEREKDDRVVLVDLVRGYSEFPPVNSTTLQLFHKSAAESFASLSGKVKSAVEIGWAIESEYHALLAGDRNLAPQTPFADSALSAIKGFIGKHEYDRAKPLVDELLKSEKCSAETFELGAVVYARLGDCDQAFSLAKEALSRDSDRQWIVTEVGRLAHNVYRSDITMQCVELARKTGFANAYLSTLEGRIALRESGHAKAVELFRTAVQLSEAEYRPRDAWPHFYLGRSLLKIGETEEAIDVLYKGDEIVTGGRRPDKRLALAIRTQLLVAYVYSENWEAAKEIAELIGSEHSRNPEVIWALTLYRVATNKYEKPDEVIKATLRQLDPAEAKDRYQRSQVHLFRAFMFLGLDELSRASDEFSRAHAADSTNVFVMLRWAQTLVGLAHESGADDEPETARHCAEHAKTLAEKVLEFDHKNEEALRILESLSDDFNVT